VREPDLFVLHRNHVRANASRSAQFFDFFRAVASGAVGGRRFLNEQGLRPRSGVAACADDVIAETGVGTVA
jgi:hypothetical protein